MSLEYLFPPQPLVSAAISGTDSRFPVNRIFCVGRNYLAHALEMGASVDKANQEPFYFTKTPCHLVPSGAQIPYPPGTADFHYEMELVVAIGRAGFKVHEDAVDPLVYGYACGLDMTRRDLQAKAKASGKPWDLAKNFEQAAVLSAIRPKSQFSLIENGQIELRVNGEVRQSSNIAMMIWNIREIIAHLSGFYHLQPGDLIYTGTPEGVGAVVAGDELKGSIQGVGEISLTIT